MTDLVVLAQAEPPCTGAPVDVFFPRNRTSSERAKAICSDCPIRAACLEFALEVPQYGVWGGTTTRERAAIARELGQPYNLNWTPKSAGRGTGGYSPEVVRRHELRAGAPKKFLYAGAGGHDRMLTDVAAAHARGLTRGQISAELRLSERSVRTALIELATDERVAS